ncbi:unnamed protein product [Thlaspi arvense]|uniref:Cyclin N-terminal domain-containing protein n=1 Tax=Thlaspi arvense TaxID=13288 RepID=A0AAU9RQN2_THLAR|nr:unnamed protein product [Thlaspi arvense]
MSTEIAHLRRRLVEFLIQSTTQLKLPPIVKYSSLSLFFDRFRPCVVRLSVWVLMVDGLTTQMSFCHSSSDVSRKLLDPLVCRFLQKKKAQHWLLQPLTESNLQLFVLISIWISCKMHCSRGLSVQSMKSLGDKVITEQLFTVGDFLEAELVFLKVLRFEIGTLNIAYTLLEDLFIQFKEVAKVGELLNFEACMDMMDLLYEKEETSVLYQSSTSLAVSILVT